MNTARHNAARVRHLAVRFGNSHPTGGSGYDSGIRTPQVRITFTQRLASRIDLGNAASTCEQAAAKGESPAQFAGALPLSARQTRTLLVNRKPAFHGPWCHIEGLAICACASMRSKLWPVQSGRSIRSRNSRRPAGGASTPRYRPQRDLQEPKEFVRARGTVAAGAEQGDDVRRR